MEAKNKGRCHCQMKQIMILLDSLSNDNLDVSIRMEESFAFIRQY